jgi:hypothetical protein
MKILTTYDNKSYDLTEEQHQKIMDASASGDQKGIWLKGDYIGWGSIKAIAESPREYGQEGMSWDDIKALPAAGWGLVDKVPIKGLEAMIRGVEKYIKNTFDAKDAKMLLGSMKLRQKKLKINVSTTTNS